MTPPPRHTSDTSIDEKREVLDAVVLAKATDGITDARWNTFSLDEREHMARRALATLRDLRERGYQLVELPADS